MATFDYISDRGVIVPDTATIRQDVVEEWRSAFGQDLVTTPETPQGVLITAEVEARDAVARNNAAVANQINPDIAGGVFLDAIWALTGGRRRTATHSLASSVVLTGRPGTIIPAGALVGVEETGQLFALLGTAVIGKTGQTTADFQAVDSGPVQASSGQLNQIVSGVLGWETVSNPSDAILGQASESDIASRARRRNTLALQSTALPEAITSRLHDLEGVRSLAFRENVGSEPLEIDGVTLKPHSIYVCVEGGSDDDIARALLESKSLGAGWNGATTVSITEPVSGQRYDVSFDRAESVPVFVRVTARFNGLDAQTIIPAAIIAYKDGELDGDEGFTVGRNVSPFELAGAVNQVEPRLFVTRVEVSLDGQEWGMEEIPISIRQVAAISVGAIQVIPA